MLLQSPLFWLLTPHLNVFVAVRGAKCTFLNVFCLQSHDTWKIYCIGTFHSKKYIFVQLCSIFVSVYIHLCREYGMKRRDEIVGNT